MDFKNLCLNIVNFLDIILREIEFVVGIPCKNKEESKR